MSTILKALRRLEDDQKAQDERSIRERVLAGEASQPVPSTTGRSVVLLLAGGLAVLAVAGAAAFWILLETQTAGNLLSPDPSEAALASAAGKPAPAQTALTSLPQVSTPPPRRVPAPVPPAAPPVRRVAASDATPGIADDIALVVRKEPVGSPPVEKPPARKVAAVKKAKPAPQALEAPPIRKLERAPMPEFVVTQTVWHPAASRRVAMIRLKGEPAARSYSEGDGLGSLELVEIQPAAVIFRRGAVKIKRSIGR